MKKLSKFLKGSLIALAMMLVVVPCAAIFAGCGTDAIVGTWKLDGVAGEEGAWYTLEEYSENSGETITEDSVVVTVKSDGTFTFKSDDSEDPIQGTWTKNDDGVYIITAEGEGIDSHGSITDGKLILSAYDDASESYRALYRFAKQ